MRDFAMACLTLLSLGVAGTLHATPCDVPAEGVTWGHGTPMRFHAGDRVTLELIFPEAPTDAEWMPAELIFADALPITGDWKSPIILPRGNRWTFTFDVPLNPRGEYVASVLVTGYFGDDEECERTFALPGQFHVENTDEGTDIDPPTLEILAFDPGTTVVRGRSSYVSARLEIRDRNLLGRLSLVWSCFWGVGAGYQGGMEVNLVSGEPSSSPEVKAYRVRAHQYFDWGVSPGFKRCHSVYLEDVYGNGAWIDVGADVGIMVE